MAFQPPFHVNGFKPWVPSPVKPHPSHRIHKAPNSWRYPTPVSASSSSPSQPPNRDPTKQCSLAAQNPKHHPLPTRPPAEVCVPANAKPCSPRSPRRPTNGRSWHVSNSLSTKNSNCHTTTSNVGNNDTYPASPDLLGDVGDMTAHVPSELPSLEGEGAALDDLPSPSISSLEDSLGQYFQLPDASDTVPIDPEILADGEPWNINKRHHTAEQASDQSIQEFACTYPEPPPTFQDVANHLQHSTAGRPNPQDPQDRAPSMNDHNRGKEDHRPLHLINYRYDTDIVYSDAQDQNPRFHAGKPSKRCKRPTKGTKRSERSSKRRRTATTSQEYEHSFTTLRSSFLSIPLEDRLQFISWLFEGALSRSISDCERIVPPTSKVQDSVQNQPRGATKVLDENSRSRYCSRKGMPWSPEEKSLLLELRGEQKLPWSDVTRLFSERFLGRSQSSIQVYWSTYLKDT